VRFTLGAQGSRAGNKRKERPGEEINAHLSQKVLHCDLLILATLAWFRAHFKRKLRASTFQCIFAVVSNCSATLPEGAARIQRKNPGALPRWRTILTAGCSRG
jgi:hypothetical protein